MRSARVEHLIRFLKCPIKIADTFRPYFFGIPYKSRAVIPHAIAASSWAAAAAVDFATQRRDLVPEVAQWALDGGGGGLWVRFSVLALSLSLALFAIRKFFFSLPWLALFSQPLLGLLC